MQLHYNILWIDNDIEDYIATGDVSSISTYLSELGFVPNLVTVKDEESFDENLLKFKYDLIISDFNLNNTTGDLIIEKVREEKGYDTEILFYSAKVNFRENPEVMQRLAFLDRISFHTGRDTFLDKIEKLIRLTVNKLLELDATRGLITSATSELDVLIEDITLDLVYGKLNKSEEEARLIGEDYISQFLDKSSAKFRQRLNENGFRGVLSSIEAFRKWRIFRDVLKEYFKVDNDPYVKEFLNQNKTYFDQVINIRNKFAHAKEMTKDGKKCLVGQIGKEDFVYSIEQCVEIRQNIIRHKQSFIHIVDHLNNK